MRGRLNKISIIREESINHIMPNIGKYSIHPIPLCAVENFPRAQRHWLLRVPLEETIWDCNYTWYVEGPGEKYLIDTGMGAERFAARKYKVVHIQTLDEGLNKLGLEVADIDYVILTHAHHDHVANLRRFPRAKAIIQRAELDQANNPFAYTKPRLPADYPDLIKGARWEVVEGDTLIDENIELLFTPGHSAGGQSVAVKTSQGLAIITGFCCVQENFAPPEEFKNQGFPFTIGVSHTNPVALYESTKKVLDLADIIIPCHEYEKFVNVGKIG
jgi:glyoxylase-like metal-dependent hydrolase (beta-lactamase superfamily II)